MFLFRLGFLGFKLYYLCLNCFQTEQGNSAKRRRHSGRFTVQRVCIGSCERLLYSPTKYLAGKTLKSVKETSVDPSLQGPGDEQTPHTVKQVCQHD